MIDKEMIERLAELAQLQFSEAELEGLRSELDELVMMAARLREYELCETLVTDNNAESVFRPDEIKESFSREHMICGAKTTADGFITVPKVLGDE